MLNDIKAHWRKQTIWTLLIFGIFFLGTSGLNIWQYHLRPKELLEHEWVVVILALSIILPTRLYLFPALAFTVFALWVEFGLPQSLDVFRHLTWDQGLMLFMLAGLLIVMALPQTWRRPAAKT